MQNQRSVLPSMLALPRGGTTAPTTPLLRFMIAYAQPKVNMRAKLLPYANRKADTETAAQAVRCARTAQAVRPVRAGSFAVNHSGELPLRAAGAQEGRQPAVFHPLVNLPFSLGESGADCRHVTASKMGNGSRVTVACLSPPFRSSQIAYCYTGGFIYAVRGITVPRNS